MSECLLNLKFVNLTYTWKNFLLSTSFEFSDAECKACGKSITFSNQGSLQFFLDTIMTTQ